MQCDFSIQVISVIGVMQVILPSLCYCSHTFKFNTNMMLFMALLWFQFSILCGSTLLANKKDVLYF